MINPNRNTSEEVLRRLKESSYERMRVELKNSIELLMKDFDMDWGDIGRLLDISAGAAKNAALFDDILLSDLNLLAHLFSCEPYIIFRPRNPWIQT